MPGQSKPVKPAFSLASSDASTIQSPRMRHGALEKAPPRDLLNLVTKEIQARANAVLPALGKSCLLRSTPPLLAPKPPTMQTAVGDRRHLRIQTTVGEQRRCSRPWQQSRAAGRCNEVEAASARRFVGCASSACTSEALVVVQKREEDANKTALAHRIALAKEAMWSFAPMFIAAPLQLLSPFAGLGGVSMAMMPPPGAPPGFQRGALGMPGMPKEEEQFMELIFPGWDANSFVWQITCWQVIEFLGSMALGHVKANPTPCVLYRLGASWGPAVASGQIWRLVTPVFLHANLTHLLFNVFFQLRMGFGMEKQFGRNKMMLIYFVCGVVGNLMSITVDPFKLAVGASTAGFGLIGVWLAEILLSWEILGPARERTIIWIVFMLVSVTTMSTMTPNMDLWGHLGGALGGFLLSILISDMKESDRPEWYPQVRAAAALGLALFLSVSLSKIFVFGPRLPIPDCPFLQTFQAVIPAAWQGSLPQVAQAAAAAVGGVATQAAAAATQ